MSNNKGTEQMENVVALMGVFLFWAALFWLPLTTIRAIRLRGQAQSWALAGIFLFVLVLLGYTRAMQRGSVYEAFGWSIAWAMPVGVALFVRRAKGAPHPRADKFIAIAVLVSFPLMMPILPTALRSISDFFWGA